MDDFTTVFIFTQKAADIFKDDLGRMALGGVAALFFSSLALWRLEI